MNNDGHIRRWFYQHSGDLYYLALLTLIFGSVGMQLLSLERSLWFDEYSSIELIQSEDFLNRLLRYNTPPLFHVLLRSWAKIHQSEAFLRLFSVVFGIASFVTVLKLGSLYSRSVAITLGVVQGSSLLLLRYFTEIRSYGMLALSTNLCILALLLIRKSRSSLQCWIFLAASLTFGILSHTVGLFLLGSAVGFLLSEKIYPSKKLIPLLMVPVITFFVLFLVLYLPHLSAPWWVREFSLQTFKFFLNYTIGWLYLPESLPKHSLVIGMIALACFGKFKKNSSLFYALMGYLLPLFAFSIFHENIAIPRILIPAWILGSVWFTIHLFSIGNPLLRRAALSMLFTLAIASGWSWITTRSETPSQNFRHVMTKLDALRRPGEPMVLCPGSLKYHGAGTFYTNVLRSEMVAFPNSEEKLKWSWEQLQNHVTAQEEKEGYFNFYVVVSRRFHHRWPQRLWREMLKKYGDPTRLVDSSVKLYRFSSQSEPMDLGPPGV